MEHVTSVVGRIRAIEARVRPATAPGGFAQALAHAQRTDSPVASLRAAGSTTTAAPARSPAGPGGVTLAQMLGRPVPAPGGLAGTANLTAVPTPVVPGTSHLPVAARVSSGFGPRVHPVTGQHRLHAGIDFAAPPGTPIGAARAGTVTFAGDRGGYGNLVIVDHGDGIETRYAHQATIAVTAGERVGAGELLGTVGSTGLSTGPHLHFELRRGGEPVDPAPWLGLHGHG